MAKRNVRKVHLLFVLFPLGTLAPPSAHAATISLGTAQAFAALAGSTLTNTGASVLNGEIGVSPGSTITGFPPGVVTNGTFHANDALAIMAHADAQTAYNGLAALAFTVDLSGQDLGGLTLTPGVYRFSSAAQLTGTLTLDGLGQAAPEFIFQVGSTLTTASASAIVLVNGADALGGVFFQVGSSTTLGTNSSFSGTIISGTSSTLTTGASLAGRVISLEGAVTLDTNVVTIPEPVSSAMLVAGLTALAVRRRRVA